MHGPPGWPPHPSNPDPSTSSSPSSTGNGGSYGDLRERIARLETSQWHTTARLADGSERMKALADGITATQNMVHAMAIDIRGLQAADHETVRELDRLWEVTAMRAPMSTPSIVGWIGSALAIAAYVAGKISLPTALGVIGKLLGSG